MSGCSPSVRLAAASLGLVALGRSPASAGPCSPDCCVVAATPLAGPIILFVATPTQSLTKHLLYAVIARPGRADRRVRGPGRPVHPGRCRSGGCGTWGTSPTASSASTWWCCTSSWRLLGYELFRGDTVRDLGTDRGPQPVAAELLYRCGRAARHAPEGARRRRRVDRRAAATSTQQGDQHAGSGASAAPAQPRGRPTDAARRRRPAAGRPRADQPGGVAAPARRTGSSQRQHEHRTTPGRSSRRPDRPAADARARAVTPGTRGPQRRGRGDPPQRLRTGRAADQQDAAGPGRRADRPGRPVGTELVATPGDVGVSPPALLPAVHDDRRRGTSLLGGGPPGVRVLAQDQQVARRVGGAVRRPGQAGRWLDTAGADRLGPGRPRGPGNSGRTASEARASRRSCRRRGRAGHPQKRAVDLHSCGDASRRLASTASGDARR